MFKGHHFIKLINDNWVLDMTEYQGYKVNTDKNNNVIDYKLAFTVKVSNNEVIFNKLLKVPLKILKEASNVIIAYERQ